MFLIFLFGLVLVLIAASAVLGFATALYIVKPSLWQSFPSQDRRVVLLAQIGLGLAIAIFTPLVAGLSYALSGTSWMVTFFGDAGTWFWAWVGLTWLIGVVMGCLLRHDPRDRSEAGSPGRLL